MAKRSKDHPKPVQRTVAGWVNPDPAGMTTLGNLTVPRIMNNAVQLPGAGAHGEDANVELRFEVVDNAMVLTGISTTTGLDVREALARLTPIEAQARRALAFRLWLSEGVTGEPAEEALRAAIGTPIARRKNRLTPEHFRAVAKVYQKAAEAGEYPTKAVAAEFKVSRSTAAHWVVQARRDGYLPETKEA